MSLRSPYKPYCWNRNHSYPAYTAICCYHRPLIKHLSACREYSMLQNLLSTQAFIHFHPKRYCGTSTLLCSGELVYCKAPNFLLKELGTAVRKPERMPNIATKESVF